MNTKELCRIIIGLALIAGAAAGWHFIHIAGPIACIVGIIGLILIGDSIY